MNSSDPEDASDNPLPEEAQGAAAPADPLAAAKKEAADNHDRYLRAVADLENFRRRTVREKEELRLYASSRLLEDLLPALDNLGLGLAAARQPKADLKGLANGVELVQQQLKAAL
ncbi:MAG TPA: nucleotide exchange factor GrpE, partial [Opitutaceae bacterium]